MHHLPYIPLSALKEGGMRARQAGFLRENETEEENEESGAETAFDGATKTTSLVLTWSQLWDV